MRWGWGLAAGVIAVVGYLRLVRPWTLHWGATGEEVARHLPEDDLVADANFEATRAITIDAGPGMVWPWLIQIGRGRAGWYSYDRLDNEGKQSAGVIIPQLQRMEVGDVVPMAERNGEPVGPTVLAADRPRALLWGDPHEPHRFTWQWLLRPEDQGRTRLIARVRCRLSLQRGLAGMPGWLFALLMEFADPIMMRRQLLNLKDRAESGALRRTPSAPREGEERGPGELQACAPSPSGCSEVRHREGDMTPRREASRAKDARRPLAPAFIGYGGGQPDDREE